jgi:hypothetical protein
MGIFLKIENLPFWTGLLLIMRGSLQRASCGEQHTHGKKGKGPCDFPKELFTLTAVLGRSVAGLLAYLLGNRGDTHAMLLPVIVKFKFS